MGLDLDLIPSFLVLVHEKHYGKAAARLHMTAPALSRHIQRLERQVGVELLKRGPAGVLDVTSAGLRFAAMARPLLDHAEATRAFARDAPARRTLRFGIPAGAAALLRQLDLARVALVLRRNHPEVRLACVGVPFPQLTNSLTDGWVDVLWTNSPMRHPAVESVPLGLTSRRIGVVGARHAFADARELDVEFFMDEPMLYNPALPEEWMSPFWFGDIRPKNEAQLVPVDARDHSSVLGHARSGTGVTTALELSAPALGPQLRAVRLTGVRSTVFHAAHRRADRSGPVTAVLDALLALGSRQLV